MAKAGEMVIKVIPDTAEAEKKLASMAIILRTLEARLERLQEGIDKANVTISRKETDKRG